MGRIDADLLWEKTKDLEIILLHVLHFEDLGGIEGGSPLQRHRRSAHQWLRRRPDGFDVSNGQVASTDQGMLGPAATVAYVTGFVFPARRTTTRHGVLWLAIGLRRRAWRLGRSLPPCLVTVWFAGILIKLSATIYHDYCMYIIVKDKSATWWGLSAWWRETCESGKGPGSLELSETRRTACHQDALTKFGLAENSLFGTPFFLPLLIFLGLTWISSFGLSRIYRYLLVHDTVYNNTRS